MELLREMRVVTADNRVLGGAEAVVEISRTFWWAWWLVVFARLPRGLALLNWIYRRIAARRHCASGACNSQPPTVNLRWLNALPLLVLPSLAAFLTWDSEGWVMMWTVALGLFLGLKWLSWRDAGGTRHGWARSAAYLMAWPGMDARRFLDQRLGAESPRASEWLTGGAKLLGGAVLVWGAARFIHAMSPLTAGWVGMIGVVLCLHFGLFHLLSLAWRKAGVSAPPLMNEPLRATSLAEFWGKRWNLGFSVPARRFLLKPLASRFGNASATLLVFLVSGLLHELVISLPARANCGLPTAYFLLQGIAMLVERSTIGRRFRLGAGWRGWLFTFFCAAGPAFWLFHPSFVDRVILPFLQTIGAF